MASYTASFLSILIVILLLLIPLVRIFFLIEERKERSISVINALQNEWGQAVSYNGLVLAVPAIKKTEQTITEKGKEKKVIREKTIECYFYPQHSTEDIKAQVNEKKRGIFAAPTYNSTIVSKASFDVPQIMKSNSSAAGMKWEQARIILVTGSDTRFKSASPLIVNGKSMKIESELSAGFGTPPLKIDPQKPEMLEVISEISVNGSEALIVEPLAETSVIHLKTNWSDPAFSGRNLPVTSRELKNGKGYTATWKTQNVIGNQAKIHSETVGSNPAAYALIRFITPIDHYQLNERTVKYGVLVLVLTFAVFFLIQLVGRIQMHPLHYLMVGLALALFYCLLLAFSEQTGFIPAYLIASATIIILISWYTWTILRNKKFSVMAVISMTLLYAFILVIVNLEVYALIVGSIGLLFVLAAIMSVTRKLSLNA